MRKPCANNIVLSCINHIMYILCILVNIATYRLFYNIYFEVCNVDSSVASFIRCLPLFPRVSESSFDAWIYYICNLSFLRLFAFYLRSCESNCLLFRFGNVLFECLSTSLPEKVPCASSRKLCLECIHFRRL